MDLLKDDQLVSVEEIATRIKDVHAQRTRLQPVISEDVKSYNVDGFKLLLRDVNFGWSELDIRGRRAFLVQLIDQIHVNAEGVSIDWSF